MIDKKVTFVKKSLGLEAIKILEALFEETTGKPPTVTADRFRATNSKWMKTLDILEHSYSLIERSRDYKSYLIRPYALPLIDSEKSNNLLAHMNDQFLQFKGMYLKDLNMNHSVDELITINKGEIEEEIEALYYLSECHDIWSGKSTTFPYGDSDTLNIAEKVLVHENIYEILDQYYDWHFLNPRNEIAENETTTQEILKPDSKENKKNPAWYDELDDKKKALFNEIHNALNQDSSALPTMGLRTLIETVMVEKIGDQKSFSKNLKEFKKQGYITEKYADVLKSVLNAGHAAAHRAYFPDKDDINTCLSVVEHLVESIYILHPKVEKVALNTPNRSE